MRGWPARRRFRAEWPRGRPRRARRSVPIATCVGDDVGAPVAPTDVLIAADGRCSIAARLVLDDIIDRRECTGCLQNLLNQIGLFGPRGALHAERRGDGKELLAIF